jgi:hypothetical protein
MVKTEDAVATALVASWQKNAKNAAQAYPDRPGYGTLGRPVTVRYMDTAKRSTSQDCKKHHRPTPGALRQGSLLDNLLETRNPGPCMISGYG